MEQVTSELLGECHALSGLCETFMPEQWLLRTHFYSWTPWDEIAHLVFFDETGLQAVTDPALFAAGREALQAELDSGEEISAICRRRYGHLGGASLLRLWRARYDALVSALASFDPKTRLPWYGPDMSAGSFATARLMETWAHGQDILDMLHLRRGPSPGLRNIAYLGVTTYAWTFANRALPVPQPIPFVDLAAPDGSHWTWGQPSAQDYVRGLAEDFALLVTQRRHRDDTGLRWAGQSAEMWTRLAQCFAGPPVDGPAAGRRLKATCGLRTG